MKFEMQEVSVLGRRFVFEADPEVVRRERQKILRELQNTMTVNGFRRGKAPESILEGRFADRIRERILQSVIPNAYRDAVREKGLEPILEPEVSEVTLEGDRLSFQIYTELKPEVRLGKYEGLTLKKLAPEPVSEEDVGRVLGELERRPEFAASIVDPEKRRAWSRRIREQLELTARSDALRKEDEQVWDQLLSGADFPLPERVVEKRIRRVVLDHLRCEDLKGRTTEEIEKLAGEISEKVRPAVERELRKYFILDRIGREEKIEATEAEIQQHLAHLGQVSGKPQEDVRRHLEESGKMDDVAEDIRLDKVFRTVRDRCQVIERIILPGERGPELVREPGEKRR